MLVGGTRKTSSFFSLSCSLSVPVWPSEGGRLAAELVPRHAVILNYWAVVSGRDTGPHAIGNPNLQQQEGFMYSELGSQTSTLSKVEHKTIADIDI